MDEDQVPSHIVPPAGKTMGDRIASFKHTFFTRQGLIGDYDYGFLFRPNLPFVKRYNRPPPFFGLNDKLPVLLTLLLGFQHALALLTGIIAPPILLSGPNGANLDVKLQQYLVSTALIVSGALSIIQISRFHIRGTPYYVGTGLISVVGVSFTIIPAATGAFNQMYANGFCPTDADGTRLPCPDGYGALLGTSCVVALFEVVIAFIPPKIMLKIFPPLVTGPTVMLIGLSMIENAFKDWMGGSGPCSSAAIPFYAMCPDITAPHALPWGSSEFLGLGFSVFATIVLCERFGSPLMKSMSVIIGLLTGVIIAAATGYFTRSGIDEAPVVSFIWVHTFKLSVYGPLVLPLMAVYIICACEAIGDITASCDVSRVEVEGEIYETRIQGGVLSDSINSILATLCTITPMATFANNGVVALTRCANRTAGYCCCIFLIIMGIFAKLAAALVSIPNAVLGGMTTFLFASVAVSGITIISHGVPFTHRNRFILTAGLALGYGATFIPTYFDSVFTYSGSNKSLRGFLDAITLVLETSFAVTALVTMVLNLILSEDIEEDEEEVVSEEGTMASERAVLKGSGEREKSV